MNAMQQIAPEPLHEPVYHPSFDANIAAMTDGGKAQVVTRSAGWLTSLESCLCCDRDWPGSPPEFRELLRLGTRRGPLHDVIEQSHTAPAPPFWRRWAVAVAEQLGQQQPLEQRARQSAEWSH